MTLNLDNFDRKPRLNGTVINSPRSIKACRLNGVEPSELLPRSMESFVASNLPQKLVERRYQHFEQRRQATLAKCRETRTQILQNGESGMTPLSTPRMRSSGELTPSPARLSSQRNREYQRQQYERLEEERQRKAQEKAMGIEMQTQAVLDNRARHNEEIARKGSMHWKEVVDKHDQALDQDFAKGTEKYEKFVKKEHERDLATWESKSQRDSHWKEEGIRRKGHREQVSHRAVDEFGRVIDKKKQWLSEVERRQQLAERHHYETKEEFEKRAEMNEEQRKEAKARAEAHEAWLREHYEELVGMTEEQIMRYKEQCEERRRQEEEYAARKHSQYDMTVQRARELEEQRKNSKAARLNEKHDRNAEFRSEQSMTKLEELEMKREHNQDHIEDITRARRRTEYLRQEKHQQNVVLCDYGHVDSPRPSARGSS